MPKAAKKSTLEEQEDTPLVKAAKADDVATVDELIAGGTDVLEKSPPFGWTALHIAAGYSGLKAAERLIAARANVDAVADDGETPLHIAAQEGKVAAVKLLAERGADLERRSKLGETPLHLAVQHIGSKDTGHIKALLEARADPRAVDDEGHNCITQARLMTNRGDELEALLGTEDGGASATGNPGVPELDQVLHVACKRGQVENTKQILSMVPDAKDAAKRALLSAAAGGSVEVMEALVEARADPAASVLDKASGTTPLIAAADEGAVKMVKWLLQKGADAQAQSRDGVTALMAASLRGQPEAASALLAAKADVSHQAYAGWTALMVSSQAGHASVARALLDARAQLDATNADGSCARDLAVANGHQEVVKLLDTRAKLSARRNQKEAAKGPASGGSEDTRDLEKLLRSLGEPSAKAKPKKKPAPAKAQSAEEEEEEEAEPPAAEAKKKGKKSGGAAEAPAAAADPVVDTKALQKRYLEIQREKLNLDKEEAAICEQLKGAGANIPKFKGK